MSNDNFPKEFEARLDKLLELNEINENFFCKDDFDPIEFSVSPALFSDEGKILKKLRNLIEINGGVLRFNMSTGGPHIIKLIHTKQPNLFSDDDLFLSEFIIDSLEANKLQNLCNYRTTKTKFPNTDPNRVMRGLESWGEAKKKRKDIDLSNEIVNSSDGNESNGINTSTLAKKPFPRRRFYSISEEREILKYIIKKKYYYKVKGNSVWKRMEEEKVCGFRSWQSMKERYLNHIIPNIKQFGLDSKVEKKVLVPFSNVNENTLFDEHEWNQTVEITDEINDNNEKTSAVSGHGEVFSEQGNVDESLDESEKVDGAQQTSEHKLENMKIQGNINLEYNEINKSKSHIYNNYYSQLPSSEGKNLSCQVVMKLNEPSHEEQKSMLAELSDSESLLEKNKIQNKNKDLVENTCDNSLEKSKSSTTHSGLEDNECILSNSNKNLHSSKEKISEIENNLNETQNKERQYTKFNENTDLCVSNIKNPVVILGPRINDSLRAHNISHDILEPHLLKVGQNSNDKLYGEESNNYNSKECKVNNEESDDSTVTLIFDANEILNEKKKNLDLNENFSDEIPLQFEKSEELPNNEKKKRILESELENKRQKQEIIGPQLHKPKFSEGETESSGVSLNHSNEKVKQKDIYELSLSHSSYSETEDDCASLSARSKNYTIGDDLMILKYIYKFNLFNFIKGNTIWIDMEKRKILPGRSWHSLKERFRKRILPRINQYKNLPGKYVEKFQSCEGKRVQSRSHMKYSPYEDKSILKFIIKNKRYNEIKAKSMWVSMSKWEPLKNRTWESLKNRFLQNIVPNLAFYKLSKESLDRFHKSLKKERKRANFKKYQLPHHKRRSTLFQNAKRKTKRSNYVDSSEEMTSNNSLTVSESSSEEESKNKSQQIYVFESDSDIVPNSHPSSSNENDDNNGEGKISFKGIEMNLQKSKDNNQKENKSVVDNCSNVTSQEQDNTENTLSKRPVLKRKLYTVNKTFETLFEKTPDLNHSRRFNKTLPLRRIPRKQISIQEEQTSNDVNFCSEEETSLEENSFPQKSNNEEEEETLLETSSISTNKSFCETEKIKSVKRNVFRIETSTPEKRKSKTKKVSRSSSPVFTRSKNSHQVLKTKLRKRLIKKTF